MLNTLRLLVIDFIFILQRFCNLSCNANEKCVLTSTNQPVCIISGKLITFSESKMILVFLYISYAANSHQSSVCLIKIKKTICWRKRVIKLLNLYEQLMTQLKPAKKRFSQVLTLTLGVIISNSEDLPRRGAKHHFIIKCYRWAKGTCDYLSIPF